MRAPGILADIVVVALAVAACWAVAALAAELALRLP